MTQSIERENILSYPLKGHEDLVNSVSFSADGTTIASASKDKTIKLWNLEGGLLNTLSGHKEPVWIVRYSPAKGNMIASASLDKTVKLWTADTGKLLRTLEGHTEGVVDISFSPDSQKIATASWDGTIRLWDTTTGEELYKLENFAGKTPKIKSLDFAPDGITLASGGYKDGRVKLWDLRTGSAKILGRHKKPVNFVRFSNDGQILATASQDGIIKIWKDQELKSEIKAHEKFIYGLAVSSDANWVASASTDGSIKVWTVEGTLLKNLVGHCGEVYSIDFSPNNQTSSFILVSASEDKTVRLWSKTICDQDDCHGYSEHAEFYPACQEAIKKAHRRLGLEALREEKIDIGYRISLNRRLSAVGGPEASVGVEVTITEIGSELLDTAATITCPFQTYQKCISQGCDKKTCKNKCICP